MPAVLEKSLRPDAGPSFAAPAMELAFDRRGRLMAPFPWATFTINLSGCFLIGLISATLIDRHHLPAWLRIGLVM